MTAINIWKKTGTCERSEICMMPYKSVNKLTGSLEQSYLITTTKLLVAQLDSIHLVILASRRAIEIWKSCIRHISICHQHDGCTCGHSLAQHHCHQRHPRLESVLQVPQVVDSVLHPISNFLKIPVMVCDNLGLYIIIISFLRWL